MRITNLMIQKNLMSGLRTRMTAIAKASSEASTGHRINTLSDDPVDASQIMRMQAQIVGIQQFQRNGTYATTKLSVEDTAISSLSATLATAKKLFRDGCREAAQAGLNTGQTIDIVREILNENQ